MSRKLKTSIIFENGFGYKTYEFHIQIAHIYLSLWRSLQCFKCSILNYNIFVHVVVDLAKTLSFFIILLIHFYTREQIWMNLLNWVYKEKKIVEEIWEVMIDFFSYK